MFGRRDTASGPLGLTSELRPPSPLPPDLSPAAAARADAQHPVGLSQVARAAAAPAGPVPRRRTRGPRRSGAGAAGTEPPSEHARCSTSLPASRGVPWRPTPPAASRPSQAKPPSHLLQKLRRGPIVLLVSSPVRRGRRLGLTALDRGELRSLEALRPTLTHGDGGRGDRPEVEDSGRWGPQGPRRLPVSDLTWRLPSAGWT